MTVAWIWDSHGLQPHRVRNFKLSRNKQFVEKLTDVVGLYLNPPDNGCLVERWFGEITRKRIRRGVFKSVKELIEAIQAYVKTNNQKSQAIRVDQARRRNLGKGEPL